MAAAVAINHSDFDYNVEKPQKRARGVVTMDSSYPAGGEAVDFTTAAIMTGAGGAFTTVTEVLCQNQSPTASKGAGLLAYYDLAAGKFMVYESGADGADFDEITATDDLDDMVIAFQVSGT